MHNTPKQERTVFDPGITRLSGGIPLVYDIVPSVDSCAIGIWVKAGTRDEPRGQAGVAHFVEHTSFRRTANRSTRKIASDFENVGAYANAYTTKEETCYYVRTLRKHVPSVLRTIADVVISPTFDERDIEKERSIITEEIRAYEDEAEELIFDEAEQQLFGDHPLGVPIVGTPKSVSRITAAQVKQFHSKHYHSGSVVLTVSGNVDIDSFAEQANEILRIPAKRTRPLKRTLPPATKPSGLVLMRPVQQSHLLWHIRTPGFHSKHRSALLLLNVILGDGMTSRLNVRIREAKGLAYSVYSQLQLFTDVGMFCVYAGVEANKFHKAMGMIEREIAILGKDGVKISELKRAKEQLRASKIMSLESLSSRMSMLGKGMLDEGAPENPFDTIARIDKVTLDEINEQARKICSREWSKCIIQPDPSKQ